MVTDTTLDFKNVVLNVEINYSPHAVAVLFIVSSC